MMWGSIDSKMFTNYAHLTGTDIDREIYKLYGIEPSTTQVTGEALEPKICPHCHEINSPVSRHCHICGQGLDDTAIKSDDEFTEFINKNLNNLIKYLEDFKKNN